MQYLDIHTHSAITAENTRVFNAGTAYRTDRIISLGIHPWDITAEWENEIRIIERDAGSSNVAAIGECGIDRIKFTYGIDVQREVFRTHALLAEKLHKPLIIHCVKAYDEILSIHKELSPQQTWIIHGFRGKPQLAAQLVNTGLCISLGERFNLESATQVPDEKLFIESDESSMPLDSIYARIAAARKQKTEALAAQVWKNADKCGFRF